MEVILRMETPPHTDKKSPSANRSCDRRAAGEPGDATSAVTLWGGSTSSPGAAVGFSDGAQASQIGTRSGVTECKLGDSNVGTGRDHRKFGNGQKKFNLETLDRVGEIGHPSSSYRQDGAVYDDGEVFVNRGERGREGLGGLPPVGKEGLARISGGGVRRRRPALDNRDRRDSDSDSDQPLSQKNVFTSTPAYSDDLLIMQMDVNEVQQTYYKELSQMPDDAEGYLSSDGDEARFLSMPRLSNEKERLQKVKQRFEGKLRKLRRVKQMLVNFSKHDHVSRDNSDEEEIIQDRDSVTPRLSGEMAAPCRPEKNPVHRVLLPPPLGFSDDVRMVNPEIREEKGQPRVHVERVPSPVVISEQVREIVAQSVGPLETKMLAMLEQQQLLLQRAISPVTGPTMIQDPVKETRVRSLLSPEISDKIKSLKEEDLRLKKEHRLNSSRSIDPPVVEDQALISGLRSSVSTDLIRQVETLGAEFRKMQNENQLLKQSVINPLVVQSQSSDSGLRPSVPNDLSEVVETPEAELLRLREENKRLKQSPGTLKSNGRDQLVSPSGPSVPSEKSSKPGLKPYRSRRVLGNRGKPWPAPLEPP